MENKQIVRFEIYEMEYKGGTVKSDLSLMTFDEKYYEQYKNLIDDCFYEMRKALNIQPYEKYCDNFEELMKQKENVFLLLDGDKIISTVTCFKNEIGNLAVNLKYQRQGYGRKLMEFAISYLQKRGDSPIKLTVTKWNKNAIVLYKSLGFEITKEITLEGVSTKDTDGNWSFKFTSTGGLNIR
ncbi:MAG: GNAT family N-acetyltransferase [Oscillospiraceae bacterium]|nr:GNAT family N-acetyltransferase [Oscillospiraceae bacterium]